MKVKYMKKTISIRYIRALFLMTVAVTVLFFVFFMEVAIDSAMPNSALILSLKSNIATQQKIIATYQAKIANTNPNNTVVIKNYNAKINTANQKITGLYIQIARLESNSKPQPASAALAVSTAVPASPSLQNGTAFDLVLTHISLFDGTCNPACVPGTVLAPGAFQPYAFSKPSGFVMFDYDVRDSTGYRGHLTIAARPDAVVITNGVGGGIVQSGGYFKISYTPPTAYWRGKFTNLLNWTANNWNVSKTLPSWGAQNIEVRASLPGQSSPDGKNYIRVHYPAGSANYASRPPVGGAQFYSAVVNTSAPVTFSFYMLLPVNFPFLSPIRTTTVGKLPGLYGGIGNTGSNVPNGTDGWSTRFMWCDYNHETREKLSAGGQVLQFTVGSNKGTYGTVNGTFLGCGVWKFLADNKWHNVQQTVRMNDIGKANGRIDVCIDGLPVFSQSNIIFRTVGSLQTNGILFQTFFGGGDKSYATPIDTYADFANFALYMYPPTAPPGLCVTNP